MKTISMIILWCLITQSAHAALALDRTRIVFPEESKLETIKIKNPSNLPFLSQSWLTNEEGNEVTAPFTVVPPVIRIESQDYALLRITKTGTDKALPNDRESLFYLHVREVPPKNKNEDEKNKTVINNNNGQIQIAIESVIKMFYRPTVLKEKNNMDLLISQQTKIVKKDKNVWIENNSPFYATYFSIKDSHNKTIKGIDSIMLKPYSKKKIALHIDGSYRITQINDYGALITSIYQCKDNSCLFSNRVNQG